MTEYDFMLLGFGAWVALILMVVGIVAFLLWLLLSDYVEERVAGEVERRLAELSEDAAEWVPTEPEQDYGDLRRRLVSQAKGMVG